MDKKAQLEQKILEEQVYAKLWMMDHDKKMQREKTEASEKKKKVAETMNILTWQTDTRLTQKQIEQEKKIREQEMLKTQWVKEDAMDKEAVR